VPAFIVVGAHLVIEHGSSGLDKAPDAVFRVWSNRLRIELEAACLFKSLAENLKKIYGEEDAVASLAYEAYEDELRHAKLCREILSHGPQYNEPPMPDEIVIGPANLSIQDQIVYSCVAIGCVTETLSTALLTDMHEKANPGIIKETVHHILKDEVNHSRIGWAEISRAAKNRDVSWLSEYVPQMLQEAFVSEFEPLLAQNKAEFDHSGWGILPPARANEVMKAALEQVVVPSLRQFGVSMPGLCS